MITTEEINSQMLDNNIRSLRQLAIKSGVNYESLTLAMSGARTISSEVSKVLYWYFRYLDIEKRIKDFEK